MQFPSYLLFMKVYIVKVKVIHCWRSIKLLLATWRVALSNVLPPHRLPLDPTPPTHTAFPQAPSTPHTVFTAWVQIWVPGVGGRAGECLGKEHAQISLPEPSHSSRQHHSHRNQKTGEKFHRLSHAKVLIIIIKFTGVEWYATEPWENIHASSVTLRHRGGRSSHCPATDLPCAAFRDQTPKRKQNTYLKKRASMMVIQVGRKILPIEYGGAWDTPRWAC